MDADSYSMVRKTIPDPHLYFASPWCLLTSPAFLMAPRRFVRRGLTFCFCSGRALVTLVTAATARTAMLVVISTSCHNFLN